MWWYLRLWSCGGIGEGCYVVVPYRLWSCGGIGEGCWFTADGSRPPLCVIYWTRISLDL